MKQGRRILVASAAVGAAVGTVVLLRFPPAQYSFYPRCPIAAYLHLQCPGCGATRALAALLHGYLEAALRMNALFVCLLPFLVGYAAVCCFRAWNAERFNWPNVPERGLYVALGLALLFTIVRNITL